jgi:hypothetical protein
MKVTENIFDYPMKDKIMKFKATFPERPYLDKNPPICREWNENHPNERKMKARYDGFIKVPLISLILGQKAAGITASDITNKCFSPDITLTEYNDLLSEYDYLLSSINEIDESKYDLYKSNYSTSDRALFASGLRGDVAYFHSSYCQMDEKWSSTLIVESA